MPYTSISTIKSGAPPVASTPSLVGGVTKSSLIGRAFSSSTAPAPSPMTTMGVSKSSLITRSLWPSTAPALSTSSVFPASSGAVNRMTVGSALGRSVLGQKVGLGTKLINAFTAPTASAPANTVPALPGPPAPGLVPPASITPLMNTTPDSGGGGGGGGYPDRAGGDDYGDDAAAPVAPGMSMGAKVAIGAGAAGLLYFLFTRSHRNAR